MPDYSAGTASVRITPDATGFLVDLERKLKSMRSQNFQVGLELDDAQARREAAELRKEVEGSDAVIPVDADTTGARAETRVWRVSEESNPVNVRIKVDTKTARQDMSRSLEAFSRGDVLKINVGAAGISMLPALATGLAEVASSMQKVAQAGLAIPGVVAGAAASIGTLVLGLSGVQDAFEAVSDASKSSGVDMASQARSAAAAQNTLRNAVVDEVQARKDQARAYRDASQQLQDLHIEMRGGVIDESRAILEAQKAREDLARGNFSDVREAALRVQEADQRLIEVRARNAQTAQELADANRKGVAGSDLVTEANERVTRSQQQLADAQAGAAESAGSMSAAQQKAADAMAQLGPNAQALVRTLHKLTPEFLAIRQAASEPMLEGKSEEFEDFVTGLSPTLKKGIGQISEALGDNISEVFRVLGSDQSKTLIDRILGNTAEAQARMSGIFDPLINSVGRLTAAGTDVLPRLVDGMVGLLERFEAFITKADQDGSLEKWIDEGITAVGQLSESILNIGKSFTAITRATGGQFLPWLQDATGRLSAFLDSTEGQNKLKEFFAEGKRVFEQWKPILESLPGLFEGIYKGAQTYIGGLLEILKPITEFLSAHPDLVAAAIGAWAGWKTAAASVTLVTGAVNGLTLALGGSAVGATAAGGAAAGGGLLAAITSIPGMAAILSTYAVGRGVTEAHERGASPEVTSRFPHLPGPRSGNVGDIPQSSPDRHPFETTPSPPPPPSRTHPGGRPAPPSGPPGPAVTPPPGGSVVVIDPNDPNNPLEIFGPPRAAGGVLPGWSPGRDNMLVPMAGGEGVLVPQATRALGGERGINTINRVLGHGYQTGGVVDEFGNPITPGAAPGPAGSNWFGGPGAGGAAGAGPLAPVAPSPYNPAGPQHGGQLESIVGSVESGIQGPIGLLSQLPGQIQGAGAPGQAPESGFGSGLLGNLIPGLGAAGQPGGGGTLPGLWGLAQIGSQPPEMQGQAFQAWTGQTMEWLGNWAGSGLLSFGKTLLGGVLGAFGAGDLMNNPLIQGIGQAGAHLANAGTQLAMPPQTGGVPGTGGPMLFTLPDGTTIDLNQIPTVSGAAPGAPTLGSLGGAVTPASLSSFIATLKPGQSVTPETVKDLPRLYAPGKEGEPPVVPADVQDFVKTFGSGSLVAQTRDTGDTLHEAGFAFDIYGTPEDMQAIADYVSTNLKGQTLQLIYAGLRDSGREISAGGYVTTGAGGGSYYKGHGDHVHWAFVPGALSSAATTPSVSWGPSAATSGGGGGQAAPAGNNLKSAAQQAYIAAGLPPGEWAAFDELLTRESGWDPAAVNPSSGAFGLHQFLGHENDIYGQLGGYSNNPLEQLRAGFQYLKDRYGGSPAQALAFHDANNWYKEGGPTPPGASKMFPAILHGDEFVVSERGRSRVPDEFLHALNKGLVDPKDLPQFASGGAVRDLLNLALPTPPKPPTPQGPTARPMIPIPAPPRPTQPGPTPQPAKPMQPAAPQPPAPAPPPAAAPPPAVAAPGAPQPTQPTGPPPVVLAPVAPGPGEGGGVGVHTMPWIDTAIESTATTLGNLGAIAASAAGGAAPVPGAGAGGALAGYMIQGAAKQAGKIVKDVANVISSAMVGSVPGGTVGEGPGYGNTLRPEQNRPQTADWRGSGTVNNFNGYDAAEVFQMAQNKEALDRQAALATVRG